MQKRIEAGIDPPGALVERIGHDRLSTDRICDAILESMQRCGYPDAGRFAMRLTWEEAISNAIRHGNEGRPDCIIEVAYRVDPVLVFVRITDQGKGFDLQQVLDPTLDENLESLTGRGLLLMRAYMTEVDFVAPGNTVRLLYRNPLAPS